jgi:hypothetical protein
MATHKNNPDGGTKGSMGHNPDREFVGKDKNKSFDESGQGREAGAGRKGTGSPSNMEEDDMTTAGGRKGQFSDSERDSKGQWSPGSGQASDQ